MNAVLKTDFRLKKEEREMAIYNRYKELIKEPEAMPTKVNAVIMEEFGIAAPSTIWNIRKRIKEKLKGEN